ncbi:hypothetical protein [Thermus sp.]|uniref:hypothetical protein n=1 Tax=Thermus sp. TaxID=275 RepID=UPI003D09A63D
MKFTEPVEQLCALLRETDGYALLRNPDVAANLARGGDVDLLVDDPRSFSRRLLEELGPPLMHMERSYVQGFFWRWGHVDLLPTLEWHGAVYLPSEEVLGSAFRNSEEFLEASLPHQAVVCWLSSLIWGGFFKERYRELIIRAAHECEDRLFRSLEYAVGPFWARRLVEVAQAGRPEVSVTWVRPLRRILWWRAFLRSPWATLSGLVRFWVSEVKLRIWPPAPWVAVLGLDGSGKSSLLNALKERLGHGRPFVDVRVGHWRPGRIMGSKATGPVVDPHGKPLRGSLASLAKLGLFIMDWTIGYCFDLVHLRAKGMLLVFDRHFVDLWVDPMRYRYGGPLWVARLVGVLVPKPDLFIFLDLPAEVAHARKQEVLLEEVRRLRKRYLELARSLPNAHVVDASRPLEEVVADVEEVILRHMAARTEKRMRRLGLVG